MKRLFFIALALIHFSCDTLPPLSLKSLSSFGCESSFSSVFLITSSSGNHENSNPTIKQTETDKNIPTQEENSYFPTDKEMEHIPFFFLIY